MNPTPHPLLTSPWSCRFALAGSLLLVSFCAVSAPPDAVFVCVAPDGHKSYQNFDGGNSCHRVDGLQMSLPSAPIHRSEVFSSPVRPAVGQSGGFPRIDASTQRLRDGDRRQILGDELQAEETRLRDLRSQFNQGRPSATQAEPAGSPAYQNRVQRLAEDIDRAEGNIASLRRELSQGRN